MLGFTALVALMVGGAEVLSQLVSAYANPHTPPMRLDQPAQNQAVILVTTNNDVLDAAGGVCANVTLASLPGPDGATSLREAICAANNNAGADTINFGIQGGGVQTINLLSPLPSITGQVTIDGYSQSQATCNNLPNAINAVLTIVLVGHNISSGSGIVLAGGSGGSAVKGLVLQNFSSGMYVASAGNTITGNFIGTDAAGSVAARNLSGISINTANNTVGGTDLCDRNLISGNETGVLLDTIFAPNNTIANNLIGTNAAGTGVIPNTNVGVHIQGASNNTVGGTSAGSGNLISGNNMGIVIWPSGGPNWIQGNKIGVSVADGPLGNGVGVWLLNANKTLIGGAGGGPAANVIAYSSSRNVLVQRNSDALAVGNNIRANSIYSSGGWGIDLSGDGVTLNDDNDVDGSPNPNLLQNFPVLTNVSGGTIEGTLNSTANTTFAIEFFASPACNPSNHGEGQMYLGTWTGTTSGNNLTFSANVTAPPSGWFVTSTATDITNGANNTSEFSQCFVAPMATLTSSPTSTPTMTATSTSTATATATVPCASTPASMVAWYTLDEQNGGVAHDTAGAVVNDGTWQGGPSPQFPQWVNGSLSFDGIDDFVDVPDSDELDFGTGDFTIDAWVRTTATGLDGYTLVDKREMGHRRRRRRPMRWATLTVTVAPMGVCSSELLMATTLSGSTGRRMAQTWRMANGTSSRPG